MKCPTCGHEDETGHEGPERPMGLFTYPRMTPEELKAIQDAIFTNAEAVAAIPCVTNAKGELFKIDYSEHVCFDYDCIRIMGIEHHRPECPKYGKPSPEVQGLYDKAIAWVEDYVKPEPDPPKPETWRDREPLL